MLLVRHFLKLYELSYVRFFEKKGKGESYVVSLSYFVYRSYLKYQGASQPYGPALGRVLNDGGDGDGFCLKKINNISGIFIILK